MRILAVDFGDSRTGLACCDRTETLASPVGCIEEKNFLKVLSLVKDFAEDMGCGLVVVGHPKNMDGSEGPRAKKCESFAEKLNGILECPVVLYDERCSTMAAARLMDASGTYGKKRKEHIDEASATIILQDYLRFRMEEARRQAEENK